jgi:hypothetical protein
MGGARHFGGALVLARLYDAVVDGAVFGGGGPAALDGGGGIVSGHGHDPNADLRRMSGRDPRPRVGHPITPSRRRIQT